MSAGTLTLDAAAMFEGAAERIKLPGDWTQRTNAKDRAGQHCDALSGDACAWCASGALWRELYEAIPDGLLPSLRGPQRRERRRSLSMEAYEALCRKLKAAGLPNMLTLIQANDTTDHAGARKLLTAQADRCRKHRITLAVRPGGVQ